MAKRKKAKREFVVGYASDRNCVYGPDDDNGKVKFAGRMTLFSARRYLNKNMLSRDVVRVIYRLVPHEVVKPTPKQRSPR